MEKLQSSRTGRFLGPPLFHFCEETVFKTCIGRCSPLFCYRVAAPRSGLDNLSDSSGQKRWLQAMCVLAARNANILILSLALGESHVFWAKCD